MNDARDRFMRMIADRIRPFLLTHVQLRRRWNELEGDGVSRISAINQVRECRSYRRRVGGCHGVQPGRVRGKARRDEIVGRTQGARARKASIDQAGHVRRLYCLSAAPVQQHAQILDRLGGALINALFSQNTGKQLGGAWGGVAFGHGVPNLWPEVIHEIGR